MTSARAQAAKGDTLVAGVAEGLRSRRAEGDDGLRVTPLEESVEERLRLLASDLLALLSRRRLDRALDAKEPLDQREGVFGELGLGGERLEEVAPGVGGAQVGLGEGVAQHRLDERLGEVGELLVPAAHCRAREHQAVAGVDLREDVHVVLLADRGFGSQDLYELLSELGIDFIIRFKSNINVETLDGVEGTTAAASP